MKVSKSQNRESSQPAIFEPLENRRMMSVVPLGATIPVGGTTFAARPELGGVVIRDELVPVNVTDGGGTVIFKGSLQDRVVKENGTGYLDFYQSLRSDSTMPMPAVLDHARRINFGTVPLPDVDYRTDGLGAPNLHPYEVSHPTPALVDFHFGPNDGYIMPGQWTRFYFVHTTNTTYDVSGKTDLDFLGVTGAPYHALVTTAEPTGQPTVVGIPQQPGSIVGTVWGDANHNGALDAGESGLGNWTVYVDLNHNGVLDASDPTAITDPGGMYQFVGVPSGNYTVRVQQRGGYSNTTPLFSNVTLANGQSVNGPDFGEVRTSSVPMNFSMLLTAAQNFGKDGTFAQGDLNGDGKVDFSDILLLAQNYGHNLPPPTLT